MGLFTKKPTVAEMEALRADLASVSSRLDDTGPADDVRAQLGVLAERLAASEVAARATAEQLAMIEQRLTSVSSELARQIDELSGDIAALAELPSRESQPEAAAVVEALRAGQVRLANEQARYEIALRADLAMVAEQVGRLARH
jgi:hypothetical protein